MAFLLTVMNKKAVLAAIILVLLLSAIPEAGVTSLIAVDSLDTTVGVCVGDWVTYDVDALWASDGSDPEPPPEFVEIDRIEWIKNVVLAISGTNITFQRVVHYKDGNETASFEYVDVKTGASSEIGTLIFIPSNIAKDDIIHASPTEHYFINETVARTYMGVTRAINHLNVSTLYDDPLTNAFTIITVNYYWDKPTGVLCERPGIYTSYVEGVLISLAISEKIADTNLWGLTMVPVAEAGPDQTAAADEIVGFDASSSYAPDGTIVSYAWDFGDGTTGVGMITEHVYNQKGTYVVTLTVRDAENNIGVDTLTVTVVVEGSFPSSAVLVVAVAVVGVLAFLLFSRRKGRTLKKGKG